MKALPPGAQVQRLDPPLVRAVLLDLPGLLFFSTYTLLVLFWAEIYHQARSLPTSTLRPIFIAANIVVYALQVSPVTAVVKQSAAHTAEHHHHALCGCHAGCRLSRRGCNVKLPKTFSMIRLEAAASSLAVCRKLAFRSAVARPPPPPLSWSAGTKYALKPLV